ncbi:MAG: tRNA lysidine(34) synthetase TilS, partial [Pseudomonadales bacterium]|nr:tRNA lysidine(34) synthetase TilS [Pseudomonadales bacterium]
GSIEENARNARFDAYESFLRSGDLLLLGHHRDDQLETLFFYLFRGNSMLGIRGMPRERELGVARLDRPLLDVSREDIVRFGEAQRLSWIEDDSNADLSLDRNYLRHRVIPVIRERWPNMDKVLLQAVRRDEEASQLVDFLGNIDLDEAMTGDGGVSLEALRSLPVSRFKNLMRCWIRRLALPWPSEALLQEAYESLLDSGEDAAPLLTWQGTEFRRFRETVYVIRELPPLDATNPVVFEPGEHLSIAGGEFSAEFVEGRGCRVNAGEEFVIRFREGGERIRLARTKTLKNLCQERVVPPWLRDRLPLIYRGDELVAVAGLPEWHIPAIVASNNEASGTERGLIFHFNIDDCIKSD